MKRNLTLLFIPAIIMSCSGSNENHSDLHVSDSAIDTVFTDTFQIDPNFDFEHCPKAWGLEEAMAAPDSFCLLTLQGKERLEVIPEEVEKMHYLRSLDLYGNNIHEIPAFLSDLEELYLGANGLTECPKGMEQLKNLRRLELSYNQITELCPAIFEMKDLEILDMFNTSLSKFPVELANLSNLKRIALTGNSIQNIPKEITKLKKLEELYLSDQSPEGLANLPANFSELRNLKHLSIGGNDCCGNQFDSIPSSIYELDSLEYLDLSYGNIQFVSPEIVNLTRLKSLDLTGNKLSELPEEIYSLPHLEEIYLAENHFTVEQQTTIIERFGNDIIIEFEREYGD